MESLSAVRRIALLAAVLLVTCKGSSKPAKPCDVFATAGCIDATRMYADVTELASAAYAGRRAGMDGNAAAVALAETRLAAALEPAPGASGYLQGFSFDSWVPAAAALSLNGAPLTLGSGYEVVYDSGSGVVGDAAVVFVGYGLRIPPFDPAQYPDCPFPATGYDEYAAVDVTGKIVVALRGYPAGDRAITACPVDPQFCASTSTACFTRAAYKPRLAAERGAAGLLLVRPYWAGGGEVLPFASAGVARLPTLLVDRATLEAKFSLAEWAAAIDGAVPSQRVPASRATSTTASMSADGAYEAFQVSNVIGVVPGTDPVLEDEVVVVGAHLDHMGKLPLREEYFPGADDNASGTAVVLELARAVAASPTKPKRTLVFALWNGEELGLLGSAHYVNVDPLYPLGSTVAAFSVDMVGAGSPGLELWGGEAAPWMPELVQAGATELRLDPSWPVYARGAETGSDHYWFLANGIPAFLASTPEIHSHPTYHTPNDVASGVSPENLESSAKLLWAGVRALAMGAEVPAPTATKAAPLKLAPPTPLRPSRFGPGFLQE
jgi:aminopeptidase YwaD